MLSYLGDVRVDALGQFHAGLSEDLRQLVGDVPVLVQRIVQQTQALQLLRDSLAPHLRGRQQSF